MVDIKKIPLGSIVYVGRDRNYWDNVRQRIIDSYMELEFQYVNFLDKDPKNYQEIMKEKL